MYRNDLQCWLQRGMLCVLLLVVLTSWSTAQTKEAVILYNSVPVEVEMDSEGDIKRFKQEKPGYLVGYKIDTKKGEVATGPIKEINRPAANPNSDLIGDGPVSILFSQGESASPSVTSLDLLNGVVARLRSKSNIDVILRAQQKEEDTSVRLQNDRLDSCKAYLENQGISPSRITTTLSDKVTDSNEVSISFQ